MSADGLIQTHIKKIPLSIYFYLEILQSEVVKNLRRETEVYKVIYTVI